MGTERMANNLATKISIVMASLIAASAFLAFKSPERSESRPELSRYNPKAISAVGGEVPDSNSEVVVVMEVVNVCQQVHKYLVGDLRISKAVSLIDDATDSAFEAGERFDEVIDISDFSSFAKARLEASEIGGSLDPVKQFLDTECQDIDFEIPALSQSIP